MPASLHKVPRPLPVTRLARCRSHCAPTCSQRPCLVLAGGGRTGTFASRASGCIGSPRSRRLTDPSQSGASAPAPAAAAASEKRHWVIWQHAGRECRYGASPACRGGRRIVSPAAALPAETQIAVAGAKSAKKDNTALRPLPRGKALPTRWHSTSGRPHRGETACDAESR